MGSLRGKRSLMICDNYANIKYKLRNRKFLAEGYYVSTIGLNEETIKKYIQQQEERDIMQDKLSTQEYAETASLLFCESLTLWRSCTSAYIIFR